MKKNDWKQVFVSNEFLAFVLIVVALVLFSLVSGCSTTVDLYTEGSCGPDAEWTCAAHSCGCVEIEDE